MWYFLIKAIASGIIGNAVNNWFADTKIGVWFYKKVDNVSTWASKKLGLKVLADEEDWKKKYPNVSKDIEELEARVNKLEQGESYDK
ncbi:MAG: hypothetical protein QGH83_12820 [Candidatus Pacebacteria bacterium]|nr:hypothetical protein [Candidatus Paceibacterota bacterium]